jgi:hypothetical protein
MEFEIRADRQAQGSRPLTREREAYFRLMREGYSYKLACRSVGADRLWGINRRRKGAANTLLVLRSIRRTRPADEQIYVILDNLSAHKNTDIRAWAEANRVTLLFTSAYASWASPIEAQFGPLRRFTMAHSHRAHQAGQTRDLHAYLLWRNANSRHPDMLAAQRRERARVSSEKGSRWGGRARSSLALAAWQPVNRRTKSGDRTGCASPSWLLRLELSPVFRLEPGPPH